MAPHSSTLAWKNPMDGGAWWAAVHGVAKSLTLLSNFTLTFHFHALEKEMATHSSVLAWRIPGTVEPGGLPSVGSHTVGHDWSDLAAAAAIGNRKASPGILQDTRLVLDSCQPCASVSLSLSPGPPSACPQWTRGPTVSLPKGLLFFLPKRSQTLNKFVDVLLIIFKY